MDHLAIAWLRVAWKDLFQSTYKLTPQKDAKALAAC
jgi:hypothetical protein